MDRQAELEKKFARLFIFVEDYVMHTYRGVNLQRNFNKMEKKEKKKKGKNFESLLKI